MVEQGMARGGPPAAMELFLRFACGDQVFDALDPQLRSRVLADHLGTPLVEVPGARVPHLTNPQEFIEAMRPIFERMWPIT